MPFIESPNVTRTSGRVVDVVVMHTMETAETAGVAKAVAHWFASPSSQVSAHYCVDADTVVQCVREEDVAWHARGGNTSSIGIELAGRAAQDADEWDDAYSLAVLWRAAELVDEICARHRIPVRRLRAVGLRRGLRGVTGHADVSAAFGRSDHWDPGPAFPWPFFLDLVRLAGADRVESGAQA